MAYIEFDLEKMEDAANKYGTYSDLFDGYVEKFNKIQETLASGWDSDAGKAFIDSLDLAWVEDMHKYAEVLHQMQFLINRALTDYGEIASKGKTITY